MSYYKIGTWNAVCMICDKKVKANQLRQRWDELWVCDSDYEFRHPQDYLKAPKEKFDHVPFVSNSVDGPDVSPTYTIPLEPVPPGTFNNGT
jgi:hypothetical protein